MTRFEALFIKYLRVRCGGSWRWVSRKWNARYRENKPFKMEITCGGNQLDGMFLCNDAQELLNENDNEGWN